MKSVARRRDAKANQRGDALVELEETFRLEVTVTELSEPTGDVMYMYIYIYILML